MPKRSGRGSAIGKVAIAWFRSTNVIRINCRNLAEMNRTCRPFEVTGPFAAALENASIETRLELPVFPRSPDRQAEIVACRLPAPARFGSALAARRTTGDPAAGLISNSLTRKGCSRSRDLPLTLPETHLVAPGVAPSSTVNKPARPRSIPAGRRRYSVWGLKAMPKGGICCVCGHAQRHLIEARARASLPVRVIAKRFPDLSKDSGFRHRRLHMPPQLVAAICPAHPARSISISLQRRERGIARRPRRPASALATAERALPSRRVTSAAPCRAGDHHEPRAPPQTARHDRRLTSTTNILI